MQRKELAELQAELNRRVETLCERQKSVEEIDLKLMGLVNDQATLDGPENHLQMNELKATLSKRTEEELKTLEQRKQR